MWKQQVHLNKLPVPGCTKTHTVVLHSQLAAQGIQLVPDFSSNFRVGMIKQPYR
jgi:hypothetical protein